MEGACIIGLNASRRTIFIAEFDKSNEEVIKAGSEVIPLLQNGRVGCSIDGLRVLGVIVNREVNDGGIGKG